jgi:ABC-2 type transport system permease protein
VSTLVSAELLKLRTTRAWIGYVVALVLLTGVGAAGQLGSPTELPHGGREFQRELFSDSIAAGLIALLVGITLVTVEFRHGTITRTLLVTPRRDRVLAAKGIAALCVGGVIALFSVAVILAVAIPWLSAEGTSFGVGGVSGLIARFVLAVALWGLLGAAIGAAVQNQTPALVASILWFVILEHLLTALLSLGDLDRLADFLPGRALGALDGSVDGALSPAAGAGVALVYIMVIGAAGLLRLTRRDIT